MGESCPRIAQVAVMAQAAKKTGTKNVGKRKGQRALGVSCVSSKENSEWAKVGGVGV